MKRILTNTILLSTLFFFKNIIISHAENFFTRDYLINLPLSHKLGGSISRPVSSSEALTFIKPSASIIDKDDFLLGNKLFNFQWLEPENIKTNLDGLGPIFNRKACSDCHIRNGRGIHSKKISNRTFVIKILEPRKTSKNKKLNIFFGEQIQDRAIHNSKPEAKVSIRWIETKHKYVDGEIYFLRKPKLIIETISPENISSDTIFSIRMPPPLLGMGLINSISDEFLLSISDHYDSDNNGISGKANIINNIKNNKNSIGKFGWKASIESLEIQNAIASFEDMGVTNPILRDEDCYNDYTLCQSSNTNPEMNEIYFNKINRYLKLLAVPEKRNRNSKLVKNGKVVFDQLGCNLCHLPSIVIRNGETREIIHPFSDFLLHDMGKELEDKSQFNIPEKSEWRTSPLWGIGLTKKISGSEFYLHDGRARNLEEAILWHGGEAKKSAEAFRSLDKIQRIQLIKFLKSL